MRSLPSCSPRRVLATLSIVALAPALAPALAAALAAALAPRAALAQPLLPTTQADAPIFSAATLFSAQSTLEQALDRVAGETANPPRTRGTLLARLRASNACFRPDMTPDQIAELFRTWKDQPESLTGERAVPAGPFGPRFSNDPQCYVGAGNIGPNGQATACSLTYSFPPDQLFWGSGAANAKGFNNLNATHLTLYSPTTTDIGREYIRQGLAVWRKWCGITYSEVTDDGRPFDTVAGRRSGVGDVRFGGANVANPNFIAYNNFPNNGSDMFIDTFQFTAGGFYTVGTNNNRNLRNTMSHEHGHGLSFYHQVPCNNTKCMEPFIATGFDGIGFDDMRSGQRNYGDRFSGNHTPATAKDLGDITAGPAVGGGRSLRFPNLSTNGALSPSNPTGADWFKISSSVTGRGLVVRAKPVGGTYQDGNQMAITGNICNGTASAVNASQAGDLRVDFYVDPNGAPTFSSFAGGPGVDETVALTLGTGTRYIRVSDTGPNPAANQIVQLYDLEILVNSVPSDPIAIAGIDKIAYVGETCYFYPAVNSQATEPGATISAYQYDLDGDGIFETSGATSFIVYNTPGVRTVTIRAIDSNGKQNDDTIQVNVLSIDNCDGAKQIYLNTPLAGTTVGATVGSDAPHTCRTGSDAGVWYRFVPTATARYNVFTCPTPIDTVLSVFSGVCGSLTSIGCNDDDAVICSSTSLASHIQNLVMTANTPYYIKVSGYLNVSGAFTLNVTQTSVSGACCSPLGLCVLTDQPNCIITSGVTWTSGGVCNPNPCPVVNSPCSAPFALTVNVPALGTTENVPGTDPDTAGCVFGSGRGVWFSFAPAISTRYQISTCGTDFNSLLYVYTGANCATTTALACNNDSSSNRPCTNGTAARIPTVQLTSGTTYRVLLGGVSFGGGNYDGGNYQIVVRCVADYDESGQIQVADIFSFLSSWFAGNIAADVNGSGTLTVQDIFDFLSAWFVGC